MLDTETPDKLPPYEAWVQLAIEREEIAALLEVANEVERAALTTRLETVNNKSAALEQELLPGEEKGEK